ncbi:uncharacterized protein LOC122021537 [Zingiber officinale]|uniref:Uncharacterized protein n=1 Tax=Zingiber officinale TaxID=94328 RepID=A0A8J5EZ78_ZINOF|nr:uncharacterized protein LOC122021537 [Zingiber officinale]KAG6478010.1 hypothetical protein ZIOFF_061442 [Zingiber officinale]
MSDIALLVAEDYEERRRRRSEGWEKEEKRVRFLATFSAMEVARKTAAMALKEVRRAVEPRSSVGSAAFDGLFSA